MARNDKIVHPYYKENIVYYLKIIECCSFVFLMVYVTVYIKVLLQKKFCHRNLLILLIGQPLAHVICLSTRMIKHGLYAVDMLDNTMLQILNYISDVMVSTSFQIVVGLAVERIVAMNYINEYENMMKFPGLALGIIGVTFTWSALLMYLWHIHLVPNAIAYPLQYIGFGSASIFFVVLRFVSWRTYKAVANYRYSNIEDRYLTAQNLKAAILLIYLAPYKCVCTVLSLYVYHWVFEEHEPYYFPYYSAFYFMFWHCQLYIQLFLTVMGHHSLLEELLAIFRGRRESSVQDVKSVIGEKMMFSNEEENQMYFKQMTDSWNTALIKKEKKEAIDELPKRTLSGEPSCDDRSPVYSICMQSVREQDMEEEDESKEHSRKNSAVQLQRTPTRESIVRSASSYSRDGTKINTIVIL